MRHTIARTAPARWVLLSSLLARVERLLEANARIDAACAGTETERVQRSERAHKGRPRVNYSNVTGARIGARIDVAAALIDKELDRLTCELLNRELARKKRLTGWREIAVTHEVNA